MFIAHKYLPAKFIVGPVPLNGKFIVIFIAMAASYRRKVLILAEELMTNRLFSQMLLKGYL